MKNILITGGAGFIGSNTVHYFANKGWNVYLLDNLSRKGSEENLKWLQSRENYSFIFKKIDIRDKRDIDKLFKENNFDALIHLAAQVAVTDSIDNPREDLDTNIIGTFNLLESIRKYSPNTTMINASTNKVYGSLDDYDLIEMDLSYKFKSHPNGISESSMLDFHSPYGCSKGSADQYVIDYARVYDIKATTFRQSCIYGPRQFGSQDQGWISWFIISSLSKQAINIYGNGKQVRDILYIDDLVHAYDLAISKPSNIKGEAFNIGGGSENSISLIECINMISEILDKKVEYNFSDPRLGDQKIFVSDNNKISELLNWEPTVSIKKGISSLLKWTKKELNRQKRMDNLL